MQGCVGRRELGQSMKMPTFDDCACRRVASSGADAARRAGFSRAAGSILVQATSTANADRAFVVCQSRARNGGVWLRN